MKGAIFDLDGTLLDSMSVWATIGEEYLRSLHIEPRENLCETFRKMSIYEAACYYIKEYGVKLTREEILEGVNERIAKRYREDIVCKRGVPLFLKKLSEKGVRMCVATATDERMVRLALEKNGLLSYISRIFTCNEVGAGKDKPVIYEQALMFLGTKKEETFVFEDSSYAAETAKKAGFPVVGVYDRFEEHQSCLKRIVDYYICDFTEVPDEL